jgi:hypothetical protein
VTTAIFGGSKYVSLHAAEKSIRGVPHWGVTGDGSMIVATHVPAFLALSTTVPTCAEPNLHRCLVLMYAGTHLSA